MSWAHRWGLDIVGRRIPREEVPAEVMALVRERLGSARCEDCGQLGLNPPPDEPIELDHRQPVSLGGSYHHLNLTLRCRSHNRAKHNRPMGARPPVPAWRRRHP